MKNYEMFEPKFKMHDILKDTTNGMKGKCLGVTFYSTGCIHYGLAPLKAKPDGTQPDWFWLDETRVGLVQSAKIQKLEKPHSGPDMNPRMQ